MSDGHCVIPPSVASINDGGDNCGSQSGEAVHDEVPEDTSIVSNDNITDQVTEGGKKVKCNSRKTFRKKQYSDEDLKCPHCGKVFVSKHAHTKHVRRIHLQKDMFKCHCGKGFPNQRDLKRHMFVHENGASNGYQHLCDICGTSYVDQVSYFHHFENAHPNSRMVWNCFKCKKACTSLSEISSHPCKFICLICKDQFDSEDKIESHFTNFHQKCHICHLKFKDDWSREDVLKHIASHETIYCKDCGRVFSDENLLKLHQLVHKNGKKKVERIGATFCTICNRLFASEEDFKIHFCPAKKMLEYRAEQSATPFESESTDPMKESESKMPTVLKDCKVNDINLPNIAYCREDDFNVSACPCCGNEFISERALQVHLVKCQISTSLDMFKRKPNGKFSCYKCSREYIGRDSFLKHLRLKDCLELLVKCNNCGRRHRDGKECNRKLVFKCTICTRELGSYIEHEEHKKSPCEKPMEKISMVKGPDMPCVKNKQVPCGKQLKTTTGEMVKRPSVRVFCCVCGKAYHDKEHFVKHRNAGHCRPSDLKCQYCAKEFSNTEYLLNHIVAGCDMDKTKNQKKQVKILISHKRDVEKYAEEVWKQTSQVSLDKRMETNQPGNHVPDTSDCTDSDNASISKVSVIQNSGAYSRECHMCQQNFDEAVKEDAFLYHKACHEMNFCPDCGRVLESEKRLEVHMMLHYREMSKNVLRCKKCYGMFSTEDNLKQHKCPSHRYLTSEIQLHVTDVSNVNCNCCKNSYISKASLKAHESVCYGFPRGRYSCGVCGAMYAEIHLYKQHLSGKCGMAKECVHCKCLFAEVHLESHMNVCKHSKRKKADEQRRSDLPRRVAKRTFLNTVLGNSQRNKIETKGGSCGPYNAKIVTTCQRCERTFEKLCHLDVGDPLPDIYIEFCEACS